jgi:hypothetical protein
LPFKAAVRRTYSGFPMAQNQKTKPFDTDESGLPVLSAEEEKLVELVSDGKLTQSDAYATAYDAHGYSPAALAVRACRKIAEPQIQAHLRSLRAVGLAKAGLSLEQRIKDEQAFAQRAEDAGNFGAAGGSHDRLNKLLGLYVERHADVTAHDPVETLREIAKDAPEYAAQLAAEHGIPWKADEGATKH